MTKPKDSTTNEDDPIEKSLAERVKAGGLTEVVVPGKTAAKQPAKPAEKATPVVKPKEEKKVAAAQAKKDDKPVAATSKVDTAKATPAPIVMKGKKKAEEESATDAKVVTVETIETAEE